MSSSFFTAGSKIFSELWGNIYLAEIKTVNNENPRDPIYTIHYLTWDESLDETVKHSESTCKIAKSSLDALDEARQLIMQSSITEHSSSEAKERCSAVYLRPPSPEVQLLLLRHEMKMLREIYDADFHAKFDELNPFTEENQKKLLGNYTFEHYMANLNKPVIPKPVNEELKNKPIDEWTFEDLYGEFL